eukprot:Skav226408  [mRNA]  locus=scaffold3989:261491:275408:- [translate_table: standard]
MIANEPKAEVWSVEPAGDVVRRYYWYIFTSMVYNDAQYADGLAFLELAYREENKMIDTYDPMTQRKELLGLAVRNVEFLQQPRQLAAAEHDWKAIVRSKNPSTVGDEQDFDTPGSALDGWSREELSPSMAWRAVATQPGRPPDGFELGQTSTTPSRSEKFHTAACCCRPSRPNCRYRGAMARLPRVRRWWRLGLCLLLCMDPGYVPSWWQEGWPRTRPGSVAEAELLSQLAVMLKPDMPIGEMFRSFPAPEGWGGNYLEPDLTVYGVLKEKDAALFVEYDGYWRHGERAGAGKDRVKNEALVDYAPSGSWVVRISHTVKRQQKGQVLWVTVDPWRRGDSQSLSKVLHDVVVNILVRSNDVLRPRVAARLEKQVRQKMVNLSECGQIFADQAASTIAGNSSRAASLIAKWPQVLGYSYKRLSHRINVLAGRNETQKLVSAMSMKDVKTPEPQIPDVLVFERGCSTAMRVVVLANFHQNSSRGGSHGGRCTKDITISVPWAAGTQLVNAVEVGSEEVLIVDTSGRVRCELQPLEALVLVPAPVVTLPPAAWLREGGVKSQGGHGGHVLVLYAVKFDRPMAPSVLDHLSPPAPPRASDASIRSPVPWHLEDHRVRSTAKGDEVVLELEAPQTVVSGGATGGGEGWKGQRAANAAAEGFYTIEVGEEATAMDGRRLRAAFRCWDARLCHRAIGAEWMRMQNVGENWTEWMPFQDASDFNVPVLVQYHASQSASFVVGDCVPEQGAMDPAARWWSS